jgi:hypothetical protein
MPRVNGVACFELDSHFGKAGAALRGIASPLGPEEEPEEKSKNGKKEEDQDPKELCDWSSRALGSSDDRPNHNDQPQQAQRSKDEDFHDRSPFCSLLTFGCFQAGPAFTPTSSVASIAGVVAVAFLPLHAKPLPGTSVTRLGRTFSSNR